MTNMDGRETEKGHRLFVLFLIGLAVLTSAKRDLRDLSELASEFQTLTASLTNSTASAAELSASEIACAEPSAQTREDSNSGEFRWSGHLAQGKAIEIKGLSGDIAAEAAPGGEVEVVANKHSRRSDVNTVAIKVVEHPGGVTICAVYPTDDPNRSTSCEPGRSNRDVSETPDQMDHNDPSNVRSNDVQVDFRIKVPAGVDFVARTVNGEISANSLASNVVSATVNGSIKISTSGYAQAKTVNGEISARLGDANWPGSLSFKTVNGQINLDLPPTINANVEVSTFNGDVSSDFPLITSGKFGRKHMSGTIGTGSSGRDLVLKTLNGSINLRRAG